MIEVFKTNVSDQMHANMLLDQIHQAFSAYQANFDLEDCDRILRVKCTNGHIQVALLTHLLRKLGCQAEILPDDDPADFRLIPHQHPTWLNA
jgi:hypothetical protein